MTVIDDSPFRVTLSVVTLSVTLSVVTLSVTLSVVTVSVVTLSVANGTWKAAPRRAGGHSYQLPFLL